MGNAEKQDIHKIIDDGIKKASTLMIWIFGVANTLVVLIIGGMTIPTYVQMWELKSKVETKADNEYVKDKFLQKGQYVFLEEEQNRATLSIFKDHKQGESIYNSLNIQTGKQLDISWRSAREVN